MREFNNVSIRLNDPEHGGSDSQTWSGPSSFEEACSWLLGHGIYDKIELTKTLTVEKEVAARLKQGN